MTDTLRGADLVLRTLERAGCRVAFTLSGNHIMSLFDAALETGLDLLHVRHEAAAVHMADAYGRLSGEPGIALATGGPGHANATAALMTAKGQESPVVLLSGHTETSQLGRGGFQELAQAEMAAPVAKASWMATEAARLGHEVACAIRLARSGRPGPVHLSLPSDLLDETLRWTDTLLPEPAAFTAPSAWLAPEAADAALAILAQARRPLLIAGPELATRTGRLLLARLEAALAVPACIMESPRGLADASLGAIGAVAAAADCVLLLGKTLDFTLRFGGTPFSPACRWIVIDPEGLWLERARRELGERLAFATIADARPAGEALIRHARPRPARAWAEEARALIDERPAEWATLRAGAPGKLHPYEVFAALKPLVERDPETVLICDGGEFAQWGQSLLRNDRRLINGVGGSIGASLPYALAARVQSPRAPVFAVLGDGTAGFHIAEFETAFRRSLPFVAIVGNDARWNAEHNLQLRDYGAQRAHGCELSPARYDLVAAALGGHGELVERAADLAPAIERALASGRPACVNVMIESAAAPVIRRTLPSD